MVNKYKIRVSALLCLVLLVAPVNSANAQEVAITSQNTTNELDTKELTDALKNKIDRGSAFLQSIETQIGSSQAELELLKSNKYKLRAKIKESEVNVRSMESQLDNLAQIIESHKEKIRAIELLIAQFENQVAVVNQTVKDTETYMNVYVTLLDQAVSAYYVHSNNFFAANSDPKLLAFLAYSDSTGNVVKEHEYLLSLQQTTQDLANEISRIQKDLDVKKTEQEEKLSTLNDLKDLLSAQKRNVVAAQESQKRLLTQTQGKQLIYETLLELSEKEETQVSLQIQKLKENFSFFKDKVELLKQGTNYDGEFRSLSLEAPDSPIAASLRGTRGASLAWPVSPALGISAQFRDTAYKASLGVEHQAIDIRIAQGSQVRAAGDGVVTKAADNGMAYSYIIIAHPDSILTLYGHLSEILVKEGEVVHQGDVIGLSGGMPGTKGAGWLTTGPHLHFEVFKDWKHVDPLSYLPLELVPVSSLPEKYLNQLLGEKEAKIKRAE